MTSLLYVVRKGRNEELRYSLRSVAANLPHEGVYVVSGEAPEWLTGARVIDAPNVGTKWQNIVAALEAACAQDLDSDLVYFNDDMFITEPIETVPVYHRGQIGAQRDYGGQSGYAGGLKETEALLVALGVASPFMSYELHLPLPLRRQSMGEVLARAREVAPKIRCLHYRSLYGNALGIGGSECQDVKVHANGPVPPGPFISTNDHSFARGRVGRLLRERFSEPGPYERRSG